MPQDEIPNHDEQQLREQQNHPSDVSSISSGSSGRVSRVYSFSSQNNGSDSDGGRLMEHQIMLQNRYEREIEQEILHSSTPVVYQPIVLPSEPSLEELLRQVAGTRELQSVTEIKLRVISHNLSLQRITLFCPNLKSLTLDGSVVPSIRDLGSDLRTLVYLNVSRCGLRNLDGTIALQNLEELVADFNEIFETGPCTSLPKVKKISLRGNYIRSVGAVSFLTLCDTLIVLDLRDNPVTSTERYRELIRGNIPQLAMLDGVPFLPKPQEHSDLSSSEYKSSTTSDESPKFKWKEPETRLPERPSTASGASEDHIVISRVRPATADHSAGPSSKLKISGDPIVGNMLQHIRKNRRARQAWAESTSSISSSDTPELPRAARDFPERLQQEPVDLELGLVGSKPDLELTDENVLEAARVWRRQSQMSRERIRSSDQMKNQSIEE